MKINTTKEILKLDGTSFEDKPTIGSIISNTLAYNTESSNPHLSSKLAKKFAVDDVAEITVEDAAFIKKSLEGKKLPAIVFGAVLDELEK